MLALRHRLSSLCLKAVRQHGIRGISRTATAAASAASAAKPKPAFVRVPEAQVTTMDNGLRVASEDWNTPTCTVSVWVEAGSRYETEETNGVAHFLEHVLFKGTKSRSQLDIEKDIESRGAEVTARTTRELTSYSVRCFSKDVPWAVELLADVVRNASFNDEAIESGRVEILRQMQEADNDPRTVVMDYLHSAAYQGTPLSRPVLGPIDSVRSISKTDIQHYAEDNFKPHRMVVAAAGAVAHSELADLCKRHFGSLTNDYARLAPTMKPIRFTGSSLLDRDDHLPFAHVAIAVEGPGWADDDIIPLSLASAYIGSWDRAQSGGNNIASRLARQAHDAFNGGVLSYDSFLTSYRETSLWGMHFVANQESVNFFSKDFQTDWMELSQDVREFDLVRAKNATLTNMYSRLAGTQAACDELGRNIICYGRRIPMAELEDRIARVRPAELSQAAQRYIYDRCPVVAGFGPIEGLPDYNRIRGKMWFYRV
ncbi:hypothetical protein BOX15_Mlig023324g3 [Macrostomum lignano]|uniref:Mitochondrial-processing peptidase subunit beta n=2 Tax=Macrostomum lignano TaxID=282301 RepID=A0A267H2I9_9PLAT|nr:hypothetical protein BOX15_Mlig023324g3 [Macrostomum lignano]